MTMRYVDRSHRHALLSTLVVLSLLVTLAVPTHARAADAGLVSEAARTLQVNHYKSVDTVKLLNAAIAALRTKLSSGGIAIELRDIDPGTTDVDAHRQFAERFAAALNAGTSAGLNETTLAYQAIRGMTDFYKDSHTGFLTPEQNLERRQRQRGEAGFTGVGIVLVVKESKFYARVVIPGGPAEAAGMKEFDRILKVNDVSTTGMTVDQVSSMVRGPAGTTVTLTLQRAGSTEPIVVPITRAPIRLPAIYRAQMLDGGIGYVHLSQFIDGSGRDFRATVSRLRAQGMRALIFDIRGNIGGFLRELDSVLNAVLPPGTPVYIELRSGGNSQPVRTTGGQVIPASMPLVVLVDEGSASAAELLAAAVQESKRGTVIGEKTAGAVEVSIFVDLSDGSSLSVSVFEIRTGHGVRLESAGVKPDVLAAMTPFDFDAGQDRQLGWAVRLMRQNLALPVTTAP